MALKGRNVGDYGIIGHFTAIGNTFYAPIINGIVYDYRHIYNSTDKGESWDPITGAGLPDTTINLLAANESILFAGTEDGLFSSSDSGISWTALDIGISHRSINFLASDGNTIAIICRECRYTFSNDRVCVSTDNGHSWNELTGLSDHTSSIVVSGDLIFFASSEGVFQVINNGGGYSVVNTGLIRTDEYDTRYTLAVNNNYLFASVADMYKAYGVWRRALTDFPLAVKTPKHHATVQKVSKLCRSLSG